MTAMEHVQSRDKPADPSLPDHAYVFRLMKSSKPQGLNGSIEDRIIGHRMSLKLVLP